MRQRKPLADRFWSKVDKTDTCWLWTAGKNGAGYGVINVDRRLVRAHRLAYEMTVGPISEGLQLDHLCRVRHCVNPAHLEPVTHAINVARGESGKYKADRVVCPYGHQYTPENTLWRNDRTGKRRLRGCRRCNTIRNRARRQKEFLLKVAGAFGWGYEPEGSGVDSTR